LPLQGKQIIVLNKILDELFSSNPFFYRFFQQNQLLHNKMWLKPKGILKKCRMFHSSPLFLSGQEIVAALCLYILMVAKPSIHFR
jgi:hypothetical protein